jgi:hypothetical protein
MTDRLVVVDRLVVGDGLVAGRPVAGGLVAGGLVADRLGLDRNVPDLHLARWPPDHQIGVSLANLIAVLSITNQRFQEPSYDTSDHFLCGRDRLPNHLTGEVEKVFSRVGLVGIDGLVVLGEEGRDVELFSETWREVRGRTPTD